MVGVSEPNPFLTTELKNNCSICFVPNPFRATKWKVGASPINRSSDPPSGAGSGSMVRRFAHRNRKSDARLGYAKERFVAVLLCVRSPALNGMSMIAGIQARRSLSLILGAALLCGSFAVDPEVKASHLDFRGWPTISSCVVCIHRRSLAQVSSFGRDLFRKRHRPSSLQLPARLLGGRPPTPGDCPSRSPPRLRRTPSYDEPLAA